MPDTKTSISDYLNTRTKARVLQQEWDTYALQYPELAEVKTQEDFYIARFKNSNIPHRAWEIKQQSDELYQQSTEMLNPLSSEDKPTTSQTSGEAPKDEIEGQNTPAEPKQAEEEIPTDIPEIEPVQQVDKPQEQVATPVVLDQNAAKPAETESPISTTPVQLPRTNLTSQPQQPAPIPTPPPEPKSTLPSTQKPIASRDGSPYKSVHNYLQREWGKTFSSLQRKLLNQKIQEFNTLYQGQVHRNTDGTTIPLAEYKIQEYQKGHFAPIQKGIPTEPNPEPPLQADARKAFREQYQKEWVPPETVKTDGGELTLLPSYISGITDDEIKEAYETMPREPESESEDTQSNYPTYPDQNNDGEQNNSPQQSQPRKPDFSRRINSRISSRTQPVRPEQSRRLESRFTNRNRRGINGRINRLARRMRSGNRPQMIQNLARLSRAVRVARVAALATSPVFWIVVGIIILLVFFLFMMSRSSMNSQSLLEDTMSSPEPTPPPTGGENPVTPPNPIPNLTLEKSAGSQINNGEEILYTITVRYGGDLDVTIYDEIPANTEYANASGEKNVDNTTGVVSWRLGANTPSRTNESEATDVYTFTLTVRPTKDDVTVENVAYATAPGGTTGPAPETNDFDTLMAGQGRNTQVLGDENSFVNTVYTNLNNDGRLDDGDQAKYEDAFRKIYRKATTHNINPAIMIAIWGVESSITFNGTEFGCKPFGSGFDEQLRCGVEDALGRLMDQFDRIAAVDGIPVPYTNDATCSFVDSFLYAYEGYTPVCTMYDSNDHSRTNFVIYYKITLYGEY